MNNNTPRHTTSRGLSAGSINLATSLDPADKPRDVDIGCSKKSKNGFTLIEVLLALAIIAIGLGALFKASLITIQTTRVLKEKSLKHWVAMQGISMVQLGLLELPNNVVATEKTTMLHQTWYWRAITHTTPIPFVNSIEISVSTHANGPFTDTLTAFRYTPHS